MQETQLCCPKCNHAEVVEIVFIEPVNERNKGDRRKPTKLAPAFYGPEKRQQERRRLKESDATGNKTNQPNTMCMACHHEWHA